jgi:hypothetical protein
MEVIDIADQYRAAAYMRWLCTHLLRARARVRVAVHAPG